MNKELLKIYKTVQKIGGIIENSNIRKIEDNLFELISGEEDYCYIHKKKEDCFEANETCYYEYHKFYQEFIISEEAAKYLEETTDETIWYSKKLDMYIWGTFSYIKHNKKQN